LGGKTRARNVLVPVVDLPLPARIRRALSCIALALILLPWAVHADAPGSTNTVRSLPAEEQSSASQPTATPAPARGDSVRGATTEPKQFLPSIYNYYLGNDPTRWRTGVRAYAKVVYRNIWDGVDRRLYGNGRYLEQEFVVVRRGQEAAGARV